MPEIENQIIEKSKRTISRSVAEGEGFEPSVHFRVRHISNVLV